MNRPAPGSPHEVYLPYPFCLILSTGEGRGTAVAGSSVSVQERPSRRGLVAAGGAGAERGRRGQDDQEEPGNRILQHRAQPASEAQVSC